MSNIYENVISLCQAHGITGGKMCVDLGISKSLLSDLKSGRKKGINSDTALSIANYFGVSTDRVITGDVSVTDLPFLPTQKLPINLQLFAEELPQEAKKPAPEGEPNKAALLNAVDTMTREELIQMLNAISRRLTEI